MLLPEEVVYGEKPNYRPSFRVDDPGLRSFDLTGNGFSNSLADRARRTPEQGGPPRVDANARAAARDVADLRQAQKELDNGGAVRIRDANGNVVSISAGSNITATFQYDGQTASLTTSPPASGAGPGIAFAAINRGTVVGQILDGNEETYVGNRIDFYAVVTGVPANDIEIIQTYVQATATDISGNVVSIREPGQLDGVIYTGSGYRSGATYVANGNPPSVLKLDPTIQTTDSGSVIFNFHDGPGQAAVARSLPTPRTNNQTITTTITQVSTGNTLDWRTWNTTSTLRPNGTGTTTFHQFGR